MNDPRLEENSVLFCQLQFCQVRLVKHADYIWLTLIPQVADVSELMDLTQEQQRQLMSEINQISRFLKSLYAPDKLNIATIGNVVPQLHIHIVCRYKTDKAWPVSIWNGDPFVVCEEAEFKARLSHMQEEWHSYNIPTEISYTRVS